MGTATKENTQKWIADSVKPMLAKDDGTVYICRIKGGISFGPTLFSYIHLITIKLL